MGIQATIIPVFTQPAVRTGLLWKIPLNGALGLTTPHFVIRGTVMGYVVISWKHYFKQDADYIKTCEIREADSSASRCLLVNSYFEKGLL